MAEIKRDINAEVTEYDAYEYPDIGKEESPEIREKVEAGKRKAIELAQMFDEEFGKL